MLKYKQEDCFVELDYTCTIREELYEYAKTVTDWETATEDNKYSFAQCPAPKEILIKDPLLYQFSNRAKIYKLPPWTFYTLHIDSYRKSSINMLLSPCESSTFFDVGDYRRNQFFIYELDYKIDRLYVFNTQIRHAVLNKDSDRYLLSIGFQSFTDAVNKLTSMCQDLK